MVYTVMVLAPRKEGITHERFKDRYERHMRMVMDLCRDAAPLSHTRWYPQHDSLTDKPTLFAGNAMDLHYAVIVLMEFEDERHSQKFFDALSTPDANAKIIADEAGFWERDGMKVMVVERCES